MKKKDPDKCLYFIALVPKGDLLEQLWELKREFTERYETRKALNSPPHITLHMPFNWKEAEENRLIGKLEGIEASAISLELEGFGAFPPRVIYLKTELTDEMKALQLKVRKTMQLLLHGDQSTYKDQGFTPHLTIAFRDLRKDMFHKAWEENKAREFQANQLLRSFALLKHNGKNWDVYREFGLDQNMISS